MTDPDQTPVHDRDQTQHHEHRDLRTPRLQHVDGHEGIPGPLIDTDTNTPGDQPEDAVGPDKSQLEGRR